MDKSVGAIGWIDLTVPDADGVRAFYENVVGWKSQPVDMGEYSDFNMVSPGTDEPKCGVCHARGENQGIPSKWMVYVNVSDLDASLAACTSGGGTLVNGPRSAGSMGRFAIVRDPAGAVLGLFEHSE